jgi:hypothetical protein
MVISMLYLSDRPRYKPSGKVDPYRFARASLFLAGISVIIAVSYYLSLVVDLYIFGASMLLPCMGAVWAVRVAVRHAHCRSRLLAGAMGAACGLAGFIGYFHLDQCLRWERSWTAVEQLPAYIAFRLETDAWERGGRALDLRPQPAAAGVQPARPLANLNLLTWNWAAFLLEGMLLTLGPLGAGVLAAGDPYSENRRQWCRCESLMLKPEAGTALVEALNEDELGGWIKSSPRSVAAHETHCTISVWYVPAGDKEPDLEAYLSVEGVKQVRLAPEEADELAQLFPGLQDLAGPMLPELAAEADQSGDADSAHVWPVPAPYAGSINTPRLRLLSFWLALGLQFMPAVAVMSFLIGGTYLLHHLAVGPGLLPMWVLIAFMIAAAALSLVFVGFWYHPEQCMTVKLLSRWKHARVLRLIARRQSALVSPGDPRALFAEMCPRRSWTPSADSDDCNQGLMLIDHARAAILFEGDLERYWIPAAAILSAAIETLPGSPATTGGIYLVVLQTRVGTGTWEFPFFPMRGVEGNRWERALTLFEHVQALCGRAFLRPTDPPVAESPLVC